MLICDVVAGVVVKGEQGAARKVPPVPVPRQKCRAAQERADDLQNGVNAATHGLSKDPELGVTKKAALCEDIGTVCTKKDPCVCANSTVAAHEFGCSVNDNSSSIECVQSVDLSASRNGTAKHTVSGSGPPVKPRRPKRLVKTKLPEGLDVSQTFSTTVIPVAKNASVIDHESSVMPQSKTTFPQPMPRVSVLATNIGLHPDQESRCELTVEHTTETMKDLSCQCASFDSDTPGAVRVKDKVQEENEQSPDCRRLRDPEHSLVESDQVHLDAKNNVLVVHQRSSGHIPSRYAPTPPVPGLEVASVAQRSSVHTPSRVAPSPPPTLPVSEMESDTCVACCVPSREAPSAHLPVPKIVAPSGISEAGTTDSSEFTVPSDSCRVSDGIQTSSLSQSSRKRSEENPQELVNNNEVFLPDPAPLGDLESTVTGSTNGVHPSEVSPTDVNSETKILSKVDNGGKVKRLSVPRRKKPQPTTRRSFDSHSRCLKSDMRNVQSDIPSTRRWSESYAHHEDVSNLCVSTADAGDQLSPSFYSQQDVSPEISSLSLTEDHHITSSLQRNPSAGESCSYLLETVDTPPITPAAVGIDVSDTDERMVC